MQASGNRTPVRQQGGTKYVFAGTREQDEDMPTKVCPRCGEVLFADMEVCYGCLYDFTKDANGRKPMDKTVNRSRGPLPKVAATAAPMPAEPRDPLAVVELDEIDDEVDETDDEVGVVPRHGRRARESADDTIDFGRLQAKMPPPAKNPSYLVVVRSSDMLVRIPLVQAGLTIGRGESNDIVLRSRAVSREHLRMMPLDGKVLVEDCGATNPALIGDKPLEDSVVLGAGDAVEVCGTTIEIEDAALCGAPDV